MAEKDLTGKKIEDYNDVFADIYNTLLFKKEYLKPDQLKAGATESIYKTDERDLNDQYRDVLKKYEDKMHLVVSSFGIENQATVDGFMPVRVMGYDAGTYRQQMLDGEKQFTPVITIVLNMTEKKWSKAKSISEMLVMDDELAKYVQDYRIHVFDIAYLEDEVIDSFISDFKEIARFFKKKRLGENPLTSENELKHPQAILEFISVFTQDNRYLKSLDSLEKINGTGGAVTMCAVADALISEGERKGRIEGERKGRVEGEREGILRGKIELLFEMDFEVEAIADRLGVSLEKVEEVIENMQAL